VVALELVASVVPVEFVAPAVVELLSLPLPSLVDVGPEVDIDVDVGPEVDIDVDVGPEVDPALAVALSSPSSEQAEIVTRRARKVRREARCMASDRSGGPPSLSK
jgi:hypothetical protein